MLGRVTFCAITMAIALLATVGFAAAAETKVLSLPAPLADVAIGGAGRYLIGYLPKVSQVVIVDVGERRIVRFLPVDDAQVRLAAGRTKFVVSYGAKRLLHRYALPSGERERSIVLKDSLRFLTMGCDSEGPLLGSYDNVSELYDLETLKPWPTELGPNRFPPRFGGSGRFDAAGMTLFAGKSRLDVSKKVLRMHPNDRELQTSFNLPITLPSADGKYAYVYCNIYDAEGKPVGTEHEQHPGYNLVPAATGPLYLRLGYDHGVAQPNGKLTLHMQGDPNPILELTDLRLPHPNLIDLDDDGFRIEKQIMLLPEARALVTVGDQYDSLAIRTFDFAAELRDAPIDYLFIEPSSIAPGVRGREFMHQVQAKSKRTDLRFRLDAAPDGMTISPTGTVAWHVPNQSEGDVARVIVSIADGAGLERFHELKISIVGADEPRERASVVRRWTSHDGVFAMEATLLAVTDAHVKLRRTDERTVEIPLEKLSDSDRKWIKEQRPLTAPR